MKASPLGIIGFLICILIAIALGVDAGKANKEQKVTEMAQQRDTVLALTNASQAQLATTKTKLEEAEKAKEEAVKVKGEAEKARDEALKQVEYVKGQLKDRQDALDAKIQENEKLVEDVAQAQKELEEKIQALDKANIQLAAKNGEIDRLTKELILAQLQKKMAENKNQEFEKTIESLKQQILTLTGRPGEFQRKLGIGLVMLFGIGMVGSGGYLYYRYDPSRKCERGCRPEQDKG